MDPRGIPARTAARPLCWTVNLRTVDRELFPQQHPLPANNPMVLQMADLSKGNSWSMETFIHPTPMSLQSRHRPHSYKSRSRMRTVVILQTLIAWHLIRSPPNHATPPLPPHPYSTLPRCRNRRTRVCDNDIHCRFHERPVFDEIAENTPMMLRTAVAECHRPPASDARQSV